MVCSDFFGNQSRDLATLNQLVSSPSKTVRGEQFLYSKIKSNLQQILTKKDWGGGDSNISENPWSYPTSTH